MNKWYNILPFTEKNFYNQLSNPHCFVQEVEQNSRANYLYRYLQELETKTIVSEIEYTDGDYLEDYSSYYVRCFVKYESYCTRLHFFSESFDDGTFTRLITRDHPKDGDTFSKILDSYKGCIVARPLPKAIIGRTLLSTYGSDCGRRQYKSLKEYQINLFGLELKVSSLPFQEQDQVLGACATVALWTAFHKTADLFGTTMPRPAVVTKLAHKAGGETRVFPSCGLSIRQMAQAIRSVGLEPELIKVSPDMPLVSVIYSYLNFGLPVVLLYQLEEDVAAENNTNHTVTLTGYSISSNTKICREVSLSSPPNLPMTGLKINEFYAHDDQIGPFSRLIVKESSKEEKYPVIFERDNKDSAYPTYLIIPVYNKIRIPFSYIQTWIEKLDYLIIRKGLLDGQKPHEWDIYLDTSNKLKKELAQELKERAKRKLLLIRQHPRFLWRISLTYGGQKVLVLLADATGLGDSIPFYELLWLDSNLESFVANKLKSMELDPHQVDYLTERFLEFLQKNTSL